MSQGVVASLLLAASAAQATSIGGSVADFQAAALDGRELVLSRELATHKAMVVLFLSTVCPYARYFADYVRELSSRYEPQGVLFVGINSNQFETGDETRAMGRERGWAFPIVKDEGARIADVLAARRTPEAFLIDTDGRLRYRGWVKSRIGSNELELALNAVLAGRPVRKAETAAFGCAIDRPKTR